MSIVSLDPIQLSILKRVLDGRSVFFSGSAGTGKTFLLNEILAELERKYGSSFNEKVAKTAMTGIAATHLDGATLNSALGMGAPGKYKDFLSMHRKDARARTRMFEVLVIDECSMMSGEMFEILEYMLRTIRRSSKPAGGLQLIICGDFFQLPPISKFKGPAGPVPLKDVFTNALFAFQSPAWGNCFAPEDHVILKKIFRQSDVDFADALNCIRTGENAMEALTALVSECSRPVLCADGIKPTRIFARNADVDRINLAELDALPGPLIASAASDDVVAKNSEHQATLKKSEFFRDCMAAPLVSLKVGAQVMLLKNMSTSLVNGSRGVVVKFVTKHDALANAIKTMSASQAAELTAVVNRWTGTEVPVVRFVNGREIDILPALFKHEVADVGECRRIQIPLKLAWTITIHKSQGMTLDAVQVSLVGMFAPGQAYVALSRARSKEGLEIVDWDGKVIPADGVVAEFYKNPMHVRDGWNALSMARWGQSDVTSDVLMHF